MLAQHGVRGTSPTDLLGELDCHPLIFELNRAVAGQALAPQINSIAAWLVVRWWRPDRARFRIVRSRAKWRRMADEKIPSFIGLGRRVANEPQLTPEPEAARRCMLATAPTRKSEKASAAIGCVSLLSLDLPTSW